MESIEKKNKCIYFWRLYYTQFFICFTDASWLDGQYTIWGQVVEGMEHVDKIKKGDGSNGEVSNPDKIISMKLVSKKLKKTKK